MAMPIPQQVEVQNGGSKGLKGGSKQGAYRKDPERGSNFVLPPPSTIYYQLPTTICHPGRPGRPGFE